MRYMCICMYCTSFAWSCISLGPVLKVDRSGPGPCQTCLTGVRTVFEQHAKRRTLPTEVFEQVRTHAKQWDMCSNSFQTLAKQCQTCLTSVRICSNICQPGANMFRHVNISQKTSLTHTTHICQHSTWLEKISAH